MAENLETNKKYCEVIESKINLDDIQVISDYYEQTRKYYTGFESGLKTGTTQIYNHC